MSSMARWSYTQRLTVWPIGEENEFGEPNIGGVPYLIMGTWQAGGKIAKDKEGEEFVADSLFFFEQERGSANFPSRGDYIKIGNYVHPLFYRNPIIAEADEIKKVEGWDVGMFGADEIPDWRVMT